MIRIATLGDIPLITSFILNQRKLMLNRAGNEYQGKLPFLDYKTLYAQLSIWIDDEYILVYWAKNTLVATAIAKQLNDNEFYFGSLYVDDKHQGLGIGKELFDKRIEFVKNKNGKTIITDTAKNNEAVHKILTKYRFDFQYEYYDPPLTCPWERWQLDI